MSQLIHPGDSLSLQPPYRLLLDLQVLITGVHCIRVKGETIQMLGRHGPGDGIRIIIMEGLAKANGRITVQLEELWQGDNVGNIGSETCPQIPDPDGVGTKTGQQAGP